MSINQNFPEVYPSLTLDFANSKTLDPRITFERSSIGTYVGADGLIKYASADESRFDHDSSTGESLGLLIEESRTNLVTYSAQVGGTNWSNGRAATLLNNTTSPDGTQTASKIVGAFPDIPGNKRVFQGITTLSNTTYTFSLFAKAGELTKVRVSLNTNVENLYGYANFNLTDGIVYSTAGEATAKIESFGNGWYKCSVTATTTQTSSAVFIYPLNDSYSPNFTGDGTSGVYVWGAQVEKGSFPTSYIPTSGSTVTRSVDYPRITGTNFSSWFNNSEGSIITDMSGTKSSLGGNFGISFGSSVSNYIAYPYIQSNGTISNTAFILIEDATYIGFPSGSSPHTYGISYGSGSTPVYAAYDGIAQLPDPINNSYISTNFDSLRIGLSHFSPGEHQNFHLKKLVYYPQQFITEQLQQLTK